MNSQGKAAQTLVASFFAVILLGAFFLMLPQSTVNGRHTGFVDALFTSTSAVCVTGLIVVDTATHFTRFGQAVILVLIQLGGLGIMTFSVFMGVVIGKSAGIFQAQVVRDTFGIYSGTMGGLLLKIISVALGIEAIGATILYIHWFGKKDALWNSIFHAVSAFCNAGFSTFSTSLEHFKKDTTVNIVIMCMIILGGLGFVVLLELPKLLEKKKNIRRLSLHSRVVLAMTGLLIVIGMTAIYIFESLGILKSMSGSDGLLAALFQSVTCRTAGFNTINMTGLASTTLLIMIMLMFIGASPGSAGGGIKTTSAAVFFLDLFSYLRGRPPEIWNRTIPLDLIEKTYLIITICLATVMGTTFCLLITDPKVEFLKILFEATSAFATVGLSTGITPSLSELGKITLTLTMFAGRLGPLTLALAVGGRTSRGIYKYPSGNVYVG